MNTIIKTIDFCIKFGADFLKNSAGLDALYDAVLESRILLADILKMPAKDLFLRMDFFVSDDEFSRFNKYLELRATGKPVYKIIGSKPFFKHEFITDVSVLDPRSDTEVLVESVLENYSDLSGGLQFLEMGIGSGCVMLSVLDELKNSYAYGVDISSDAVKISTMNSEKIGLQNRLKIICKDWNDLQARDFESVCDGLDFVISNPPYIRVSDIDGLSVEVRNFDPVVALDGGADGLKCYRDISILLSNSEKIPLKNRAKIFLEIGAGQSDDVKKIFESAGFSFFKSYNDLSEIVRVLVFERMV